MKGREGAKIILDKTIPMYNTGDKMIGFLIAKGILKGYLVNSDYLKIDQIDKVKVSLKLIWKIMHL